MRRRLCARSMSCSRYDVAAGSSAISHDVSVSDCENLERLGTRFGCGSPRQLDPGTKRKTLGILGFQGLTVEHAGFEPATLCLQSRCATSCANAPKTDG